MHYYVAVKNLLAIRTNVKGFNWSFGHNMPEVSQQEYEECTVKMHLAVEDFQEDECLENMGKYHYFNGDSGAHKLYYSRNFSKNIKIKIKAENLLSDEPKITFNPNYYRFVKHRFMNLHSVDWILADLAMVLLLNKGYAPIHCSAFKKEDSIITVFAPPNTGKTLSSMMACIDHGAQFIAEDLALTDGKKIYAVPWTSTFRFYSNLKQSRASKMKDKMVKILPPLEYISFSKAKPVTDYVGSSLILDAETVTHLAILGRGTDEVTIQDEKEAFRKMLNLNRNAFHYLKSPFLTAYAFFNPQLDIERAAAQEKEILAKLINNCEKVFLLKAVNPTNYAHMLIEQTRSTVK